MWDVVSILVEGLVEWLFSRHHQWVWIPVGVLISAVGVLVMPGAAPAGIMILAVGLLAVMWGLVGGVFRGGDE